MAAINNQFNTWIKSFDSKKGILRQRRVMGDRILESSGSREVDWRESNQQERQIQKGLIHFGLPKMEFPIFRGE